MPALAVSPAKNPKPNTAGAPLPAVPAVLAVASSHLAEFRNEPPLDFSQRATRESFRKALDQARALFPHDVSLVIGGKRLETDEKQAMASPCDTAISLGRCAMASTRDAERAIDAARRAFPMWSSTEPAQRAALLVEFAKRLRARRNLFAAVMVFEAAKPWREADADVCEAIDFLEFYAREMLRLGQRRVLQPHVLGERNELMYAPLGVVGVIGPWNFPLAIPVGMMAAAMVAGNTVIWKPAEQTPLVTALMMDLMIEAGLPDGVVNFLPGRGEVCGQRLLESPDVSMIVFTGSRDVGLHILRECQIVRPGQRIVKRVVAEMGGKNALIIDASADLDSAIPDALHSAFGFSGQKCSACSRLIIVGDVYDTALAHLREGAASLKIAPSWEPGCQVNAVIDADARAKVESYIALGRREAKTVHVGDVGELGARGHYVPPSIFAGVDNDHRLAKEEIFGPVLTVIKARDFDEALAIANDTEYALTGGVHSRTPSHLDRAVRGFRCGNLYLNRTITGAIVGRQPFGGFGMSGIGSKAGGPDYLLQFLVARTVSENIMRHGFAPLEE